jgi:hypothetical protein
MPENNKTFKTILLIILIISIAILTFLLVNKNILKQSNLAIVPLPQASMELGTIGFIEEGQSMQEVNPSAVEDPIRPIDLPVPTDIFNTAGTILEIGENFIVIRGNGSNFDDQVKRDLTVVVDESTKINKVKNALPGDSLSIGGSVIIESAYNIHGKTEFIASYINSK